MHKWFKYGMKNVQFVEFSAVAVCRFGAVSWRGSPPAAILKKLFLSSPRIFHRQFQPTFLPSFTNFPCRNGSKHFKITYRQSITRKFHLNQGLIWAESQAWKNVYSVDLFTPRHRYLAPSRYINIISIFVYFSTRNPHFSYLIRCVSGGPWVSTKERAETSWALDRNEVWFFTLFLAQILRFGYVLPSYEYSGWSRRDGASCILLLFDLWVNLLSATSKQIIKGGN